jgi:hypothetical protein
MTLGVGDNIWPSVVASIEDSAGTSIDHINPGVEYNIGEHILKKVIQPVVDAAFIPYDTWCNGEENKYNDDDEPVSHPLPIRMLESRCGSRVRARIENVEASIAARIETGVKVNASELARDNEYDFQPGPEIGVFRIPTGSQGKLGENVKDGVGARLLPESGTVCTINMKSAN